MKKGLFITALFVIAAASAWAQGQGIEAEAAAELAKKTS